MLLEGWRYAFGSGNVLLAGELKNPQTLKETLNLSLLPSLEVSGHPSPWYWVAKSKLQASLVIRNLETLNSL